MNIIFLSQGWASAASQKSLLKSLINKENISQIHFPYLKETSSNTTPSASILKRFETYLASLYDQYMTRF
ncbi:hypothetical protein A3Q56_04297 [Intoshia linei]|uniref:Uncharacterized protein n=1 Tax=Intoshia linei TaxID=1819745 RepID=A0A177B2W0_9BILA|nr:hypothetical protein A3Q56_04297 [Intoshia linei]